jgi:hypothetical protein
MQDWIERAHAAEAKVAALEQERTELLERLGIAWARSKTENEELARLRKAIRRAEKKAKRQRGLRRAP